MNRKNGGFTYLALLFLVAILGLSMAATGSIWSTMRQREKESELRFVGEEFRRAVQSYYDRAPGAVKRYPARLEDLLIDNRHVTTVRHLRRIYRDPLTGSVDWGLIKATDGGIMGVYSRAPAKPCLRAGQLPSEAATTQATDCFPRRFLYVPQTVTTPENSSKSSQRVTDMSRR